MKILVLILLSLIICGCATTPQITREQYLQNQNIKIAVFPFQNDAYGVTDSIISAFCEAGFQVVERTELYRIFDELKLQMSGVTEYEQIKAGRILNVDYIILGSVYTVYKPYYQEQYIPDTSNKYDWIGKTVHNTAEAIKQSSSGLYIYANFRKIDVQNGQVIKVFTDVLIRKQ